MASHAEWAGFSDKKYKHHVYEWMHSFKKGPGNYIYCSIDAANNLWTPIYIGETGDLSVHFDNHHKMQCIEGLGATHVHAHTNNRGEQARLDEKADLIRVYNPICQYF